MKDRFRWLRRVSLALLLALSPFLASCGAATPEVEVTIAPTGPRDEEIEPTPAANTHVLEPATMERLQEFREDGTLIFPLDTPEMQELTTDTVIASRDTGLVPNGFLLKVISVEEVGENLVVQTEQAQLTEAFEQAVISDSCILTQEDIASESHGSGGVLLSQRPAPAMGELFVELEDVVFEDEESGTKITVSGSVTLTPEFDFRLSIIGGEIRGFQLVNRTTQRSHLELSAEMEFKGEDKLLIESFFFKPRLIWVGGVPVVYSPVLDVYVGVSGEVSTGISTSMTHGVVDEAGLIYDGTWHKIDKEPVHTYEFDPYSVTAKLSARVFAAPHLEIRFYGVAGPYVEIEGSLGLNVNLVSDPWWQLLGRVEAVVGIKFEVLGHVITGYEETVYFHEWIVDQAESPPPPTPTPTQVGEQIAFVSDREGVDNREIYIIKADGSGLTNLTHSPHDDRNPNWSPDGSRIVFVSYRDGNSEIYIMNADGSGQTRLTDTPSSSDAPAWSPDGSRIAFECFRDGNWDVCVMDADGSNEIRLTDNPNQDDRPAWSPDGGLIAFESYHDGNFEIYVMNADGSNQTSLTRSPSDEWNFAWSPDGSHIAFVSDRDGNRDIYVINTDGSGLTNLSNKPAQDNHPVWSPDGEHIAFVSDRDGNDEIYVVNADGSNQTRLTDNEAWDGNLAWSPDSSRIAFESWRDGNREIYVMNADGSNQTRLTDDEAWDFSPVWSPAP